MKVLVAEDDLVSRTLLDRTLQSWGYETVLTSDGPEALAVLLGPGAPRLAILDWVLGEMDGIVVCQRVREADLPGQPYLLLLTGNTAMSQLTAGLNAGADDYVTKPFHPEELKARLQVGRRIVALQERLAERVRELEAALSQVKQLQGLIPICAYCKKVRDDKNYWEKVETYVGKHTGAKFSHGICPACYERLLAEEKRESSGGGQ